MKRHKIIPSRKATKSGQGVRFSFFTLQDKKRGKFCPYHLHLHLLKNDHPKKDLEKIIAFARENRIFYVPISSLH